MNRKETTAFLSKLLTARLAGVGKYYASEVTIDWGSRNERRIDFLEFDPLNQFSVSGLEKGVFTCYEVKSCKEDVFSGNGLNFIGEKNYIVTTMQCWKDIQEKYRNGELRDHIKSLSPDNSDYWGILVAVPNYRDIKDEFYDVTPLKDPQLWQWELKCVIPCRMGPRKRSITELLFYMMRSGK